MKHIKIHVKIITSCRQMFAIPICINNKWDYLSPNQCYAALMPAPHFPNNMNMLN